MVECKHLNFHLKWKYKVYELVNVCKSCLSSSSVVCWEYFRSIKWYWE